MRLKLFSMVVLGLVLFMSCSGRQGSEEVSGETTGVGEPKEALPGADKDEHGCVGSAGYCWSEVQGRCIRLWEDGVKLSYLERADSSSAELAAYLVFATDSVKLEFFAPQFESVQMSRQENEYQWVAGEFKAYRVNGEWVVKRSEKVIGIQSK